MLANAVRELERRLAVVEQDSARRQQGSTSVATHTTFEPLGAGNNNSRMLMEEAAQHLVNLSPRKSRPEPEDSEDENDQGGAHLPTLPKPEHSNLDRQLPFGAGTTLPPLPVRVSPEIGMRAFAATPGNPQEQRSPFRGGALPVPYPFAQHHQMAMHYAQGSNGPVAIRVLAHTSPSIAHLSPSTMQQHYVSQMRPAAGVHQQQFQQKINGSQPPNAPADQQEASSSKKKRRDPLEMDLDKDPMGEIGSGQFIP